MPLNITLEIDGFKIVSMIDEFFFGEVMSKVEMEKNNSGEQQKWSLTTSFVYIC